MASPSLLPEPASAPWDLIFGGPLLTAVRAHLESGSPPALVELYTSDRCALRCKHCFHADVHSKAQALSLDEWMHTIRQFIAMGTRRIHFAGREPFLNPDTIDLLRWLEPIKQEHGLCVGAITDGFSCAPWADRLASSSLDYLDVSIDGMRGDHERLRGRGTYDRTVRALEVLVKTLDRTCLAVASVLDRQNADSAGDFMAELFEHGVRRYFFQPVQPLGAGRDMERLRPFELRRAIQRIHRELDVGGMAKRGVVCMIFIPVEFFPEVVTGDAWLEARLDESLRHGRSYATLGNNRLMIDFEIMRVPFRNHVIVSHDGYLLGRCGFRSTWDYDLMSPGNVRSKPIADLLAGARAMTLAALPIFDARSSSPRNGLHILT